MLVEPSSRDTRLGLYAGASGPLTANAYYRLEVPLKTAAELGLIEYIFDGQNTSQGWWTPQQRALWAAASDVHLYFMPASKTLLKNWEAIRALPPMPDGEGILVYPPSMVFDADDNLNAVSPFADTFVRLGTRAPDGTLLKPGDRIMIEDPSGSGEHIPLWEDGGTYGSSTFDIARNLETVHSVHEIAQAADAVTVTCERLAQVYREENKITKPIYVYPNCMRPDDFPRVDLAPHPDEVRILWQGGASHFEDWFPLREAAGRVARKYPHTKWIVWGTMWKSVAKFIPEAQFEFLPWMNFERYFSRLVTIGHDINLAPLQRTRFTECKSAIKFYEASLIHEPAVTLASNTPPYDEIQENETGLLFSSPEEFETKLGALIEDATLRKRLASNAKDWVLTHRNAYREVPKLVEFWRSLRPVPPKIVTPSLVPNLLP